MDQKNGEVRPTSAATLPNVSSPSCRSEMRLQWAQSKRKRRHVRLAASSLTLASSKERFRRITAICSTRWASISLIPEFRGGWKRLCQRSSDNVPSEEEEEAFRAACTMFHIYELVGEKGEVPISIRGITQGKLQKGVTVNKVCTLEHFRCQ